MKCCCGQDHPAESDGSVVLIRLIEYMGPEVVVHAGNRAWAVPRVYIGYHGIRGDEVAELATRYDWRELFVCSRCERVSWNPEDLRNNFCGVCGYDDGYGRGPT